MTNNYQARAKALAHAAMNAVANDNTSGITDYDRAQADYQRRLIENREAGLARSLAHNETLRAAAVARKQAQNGLAL